MKKAKPNKKRKAAKKQRQDAGGEDVPEEYVKMAADLLTRYDGVSRLPPSHALAEGLSVRVWLLNRTRTIC